METSEHCLSLNQQEATFKKGHLEEILLEGCSAVSFSVQQLYVFCLTVQPRKMPANAFSVKLTYRKITVMLMNSPVKLT